jgi:hypothetical protein
MPQNPADVGSLQFGIPIKTSHTVNECTGDGLALPMLTTSHYSCRNDMVARNSQSKVSGDALNPLFNLSEKKPVMTIYQYI